MTVPICPETGTPMKRGVAPMTVSYKDQSCRLAKRNLTRGGGYLSHSFLRGGGTGFSIIGF